MHFSTGVLAAFAAVVSVAFAGPNPISKPTAGDTISAGTPFDITWQPTTSGDITLTLRQGVSTNLKDVAVIVSGAANSGSFKWTPPSSLVSGDNYAIMITDASGGVNFTPEFSVSSSAASSSSVSSSATSSSASSSASSTASSKSKTTSASTTSSEKSSSTVKASKTTLITTASANSTITHHATITASANHTHHNTTAVHHKTTSLKANLTTTTKSHTSTSVSSTGSSSTSASASSPSGTGVPDSSANTVLRSPLALVLCVIGAIMYLN